ncbi:MAG: prolipoprotein diacylglyceryl transferase [Candidatus Omnitrophota bacterium]
MHPILVKIGPLTLHTYGLLLAVGILLGILLSLKLGKKSNLDTRVMADFIFYAVLSGLVGAKIWLFITEFKYYMEDPGGRLPSLITSAGTFFGGLVFGLAFVLWYAHKHKLNMKVIGDTLVPGVALAHVFGRSACFFAGCCWGRPAEGFPFAITFHSMQATTGVPIGEPLYPTQLMEAGLNLLNFLFLLFLFKKKKFEGQVFTFYILNYSIIRFFVEFFRGDDDRGYIFGSMSHPFTSLSVPQLVSILGIITAIVLFRVFKKNQTSHKQDAVR